MCTFQAKQERKDRFLIFREENNKCQTRKVKFPKSLKNRIFQRVQSMVFVQKLSFLLCGFLGTPRQKRVFFNILDRKEYFSAQKREVSKMSPKLDFSQGLVLVFVKKSSLLRCGFLGTPKQKRVFFNILDRKQYFLDHKREVFKNVRKNRVFQGVSPCFCQKTELSTMWYFQRNKGRGDCFFDILEIKIYFLAQKSKVSIMCKKNRNFLKGLVHGSFYHVCDRFLIFRIEKNKFKTRKVKFQKMCEKLYFSKGLVHVFCEKNGVFYYAGFLGKLRQKRSFFF